MSPAERAEEQRKLGPAPDDADDLGDRSGDRELDVDAEKHLRWLESGEGEPWPASRD